MMEGELVFVFMGLLLSGGFIFCRSWRCVRMTMFFVPVVDATRSQCFVVGYDK